MNILVKIDPLKAVKEIKVSEVPQLRIEYDISFIEPRLNGWVVLSFDRLESLLIGENSSFIKRGVRIRRDDKIQIYKVLEKQGLGLQDIVTSLNQFKPNGNGLNQKEIKKYSRTGLGSYVFEMVVEDSVRMGAKAMKTIATSKSMQNFVKKQGFRLYKKENYFYLML